MVKRLSLVALVLLLVGVIGSMLTIDTQIKQAKVLEEKIIESTDIHNIDIYTSNAKVTILPTNDEKMKVELFGNEATYDMKVNTENNTLHIRATTKRSIISFDIFRKNVSLTVYVPQKQYDSIHVKSKNGKLELMEQEGNEIHLETNNGSIHVNDVQGETVLLETDNGRIKAQDVFANLVKADSENGRIEMENVNSEIIGETSNGRINVVMEELNRPLTLDTNNGRIEVYSNNKPTNVIYDLKTRNGKISVFGENNWDTVIGKGENIIKLSSQNGSITISN